MSIGGKQGKPTHREEMAKHDRGRERSEDALKRWGGAGSLGTQLESQEKQRNRSSRILAEQSPAKNLNLNPEKWVLDLWHPELLRQ